MENRHCLNCDALLQGNFCAVCGQKASTHRITLRHFITHDLVHGVWHLDKGLLFTLRETFTRPGYAARDYIAGKRIRYYNVFYLLLLVIGFHVLLNHFLSPAEVAPAEAEPEDGINLSGFINTYVKFILFAAIPLFALNSQLLFRRMGLNFAEQVVLSGMAMLGSNILAIFFSLSMLLDNLGSSDLFLYVQLSTLLAVVLFPALVFYQASRRDYAWWDFGWRMTAWYLLFFAEVIGLMMLLSLIILDSQHMYFYF